MKVLTIASWVKSAFLFLILYRYLRKLGMHAHLAHERKRTNASPPYERVKLFGLIGCCDVGLFGCVIVIVVMMLEWKRGCDYDLL